jgi:N4-(beta-N-acetylglucosaminyl)-L-asparaginase
MDSINRRTFLKTTGIAGIGLTVLSGTGAVYGQKTKQLSVRRPIILNSHGGSSRRKLGSWGNTVVWPLLSRGVSALDAVEKCANTIEVDPSDNSVGYGGLPNEEGIVALDASCADGKTYGFGAVGALENIKTPSSVARLVMERTDHILLVGAGALKFAKMHGFKEENLLTEESRKAWLRWKENLSQDDDLGPQKKKNVNTRSKTTALNIYDDIYSPDGRVHGTVNIIAVDKNGDIAGITTTSGLSYKLSGRLGDSPIIGAGLYVDNKVGAAGATGRGEEVIKVCGSFLVVEFMRQGMSPQQACEAVCKRIIDNYNGDVDFNDKFVALNKNGEIGCAQIMAPKGNLPELVYIDGIGGNKVYQGVTIIEK